MNKVVALFTLALWLLPIAGQAADTPVAKIGDLVLTEEDMRKEIGMQLYEAESQAYQQKRQWVERKTKDYFYERAAKQAGMTRQAWEAKQFSNVAAPTEQEIDETIRRMVPANQMPTDPAKLTQLRQQATQYITNQKRSQKETEVFNQLKQGQPVEFLVTAPVEPKVEMVFNKDTPMKGPKDASVTIVEFTDFQCPWCKRSQDQVRAVEKAFPNQVKFVDKMFPLTSIHPRAMPAAIAAYCAKDQGKFWEYRDKLFDSAPALEDTDFKRLAKDLGLNEGKFTKCLADPKMQAKVQADLDEGQRYGVQGTPTFFVNSRKANFNQLEEYVRQELEKKKS